MRTRHSEHAANSSPAIKGSPLGEGIAGLIYSGSDSSSGLLSVSFDWQDSVRHAEQTDDVQTFGPAEAN